jgi:adenylate cyclase
MDLRPTPVSRIYPGVEIYATALDNLLSGDFLRAMPFVVTAIATAILAILGAAAMVFARRVAHGVAAFVFGVVVPVGAGFLLYDHGWAFPVAPASLGGLFALIAGLMFNYATEGRQKAFLKQAFRHYLSPAVIERLLEDPSQLRLGGERRELTIFFSDLQGFSGISEKLDPESLTRLLNDYLSDMTDIILEEGGTLDKYEGDAILAFWNAPVAQPDHAARAVRSALRGQRRLAERRAEFRERCGADLYMRIGLHTGEVVVGNMGSRERFDYTVIGDAANLASRLEGANKAFGTFVMVSESTWAAAGSGWAGRELARLRVVGRRTPVRVFEPAEKGRAPVEWVEFERGRQAFAAARFEEALCIFERLPDDPAARAYAARCRQLARQPPKEWDGVWDLTEK